MSCFGWHATAETRAFSGASIVGSLTLKGMVMASIRMLRMGAWLGRKTRGDLKLGVCGEHGGDPDSIDFFHHSGIDYVSCSPFRVPIARVAAAQAAVRAPAGVWE